MPRTLKILLITVALFSPLPSKAYYSVMDTGEIIPEGRYKLGLESQFITDDDSGINLVGRFDHWVSEELNFQGLLGFGEVDLHAGGFVKWIPFPDFDEQPAIGLKAGMLYAREDGVNELSFRLYPLISKTFTSNIGEWTPYASLPIGFRTIDGETDVPVQLAFGSQWKTDHFENLQFVGEVGLDVSDAYTYISIGAVLYADDQEGLVIR